jgi:hypothetical protein
MLMSVAQLSFMVLYVLHVTRAFNHQQVGVIWRNIKFQGTANINGSCILTDLQCFIIVVIVSNLKI